MPLAPGQNTSGQRKYKYAGGFSGIQRDYEGARDMVNSQDTKSIGPVANIARLFENVLWDARKSTI